MDRLILPPLADGSPAPSLSGAGQLTLVGAPGAGKTRFMREMVRLNEGRAYCLSALSAWFPEREENLLPGSIDSQFREASEARSYMRTDAVSEIDKLIYMLFTDELDYLVKVKERQLASGRKIELKPTRLDTLRRLWEGIFPGNRIVRERGTMMFATSAGDDLIDAGSLSQGERTVLYYIAAVLFARHGAVIFIDSPSLFLHPSIVGSLWDALEELRPDCTFVYDSVDPDFVSSRTRNVCVWVKAFHAERHAWTYEVLSGGGLPDEILVDLIGTRNPVLFIEGDADHSLDGRLYRLVFSDYSVKPLGSCSKVIETTRSFSDMSALHHLESRGIVDRDRRSDEEVAYLRRKNIYVPEVAEVENIFLLEGVVRVMARVRGRDPERVMARLKKNVVAMFSHHYTRQALQHVRHRIKREVECKIDARFTCITALEAHLRGLERQLRPREHYNELIARFRRMTESGDYAAILKVFNHKPMLGECGVDHALGYRNKDEYIAGVLGVLKSTGKDSDDLRAAIKHCFGLNADRHTRKEARDI